MTFIKTFTGALSFCLLLGLVAGCSGAAPKSDSYVGSSGTVTALDDDKQSCTRSCNADYDRCSSTSAAQGPVGRDGQLSGVLGAAADCKAALKSCFKMCKSR